MIAFFRVILLCARGFKFYNKKINCLSGYIIFQISIYNEPKLPTAPSLRSDEFSELLKKVTSLPVKAYVKQPMVNGSSCTGYQP